MSWINWTRFFFFFGSSSGTGASTSSPSSIKSGCAAKYASAAAKGDAQKASGAVMRALAAVQTELAPTIGYDGADGYVQLQVALMEHLADPAVAHATQAATHALCARAGITPPTSPPQ